ncbi:glutathione S-transferase N-terminal domain-containing protein [Denitrificimonas sp. JX-1]|uniref:Glutathione S-transferase N-terminal domain-containing protein n=1 Tax=Denitrificimonas halotolerans TaxID=3098930 RepID=A0ABU5GNW1_9GAMM|nr:glutathione S-transferase N-terminal domain-containing protein [Denitrificimonas sp. JX-1]MDY7218688.1 glutathione S-transferase N-terminal domain-containing protein [Denitrificimonas sp. JX-1]
MIVKGLRNGLGQLIIFGDWLTRPKPQQRTVEKQAEVDEATASLALYQFKACPFCVKVRRAMHALNLTVELRDAKNNEQFRQELLEQGGRIKVPCLRIEEQGGVRWMYESNDIIAYLKERFA